MSSVKLQKLVYYCQAWSLVWEEEPLFTERIEAWINGPVAPELFDCHRGSFLLGRENLSRGDSGRLDDDQRATIDAVIGHYGAKSAQWLVDLTHLEDPWRLARGSCAVQERCAAEISLESMATYYGKLYYGEEQA